MEPSKTLISSLVKAGLLPVTDEVLEFENFHSFENKIMEYISGKDDRNNFIWFDLECIEDEYSYEGLFSQLVEIANADGVISEYKIYTDVDNQITHFQVVKNGEQISLSWNQQSDWVENSFLSCVFEIIKTSKGQFLQIGTTDQTCLLIFIPNGAHKSYLAYRKRANKSRESFFQGPKTKLIFGHIKILESQLFRESIARLKSNAQIKVNLLDLNSTDEGDFISLKLEYESKDETQKYTASNKNDQKKIDQKSAKLAMKCGCEYFSRKNDYNFSHLMMDKEAYLLITSNLEDEVIFNFKANEVEELSYWTDAVAERFLVIDKDFKWGVFYDLGTLIFIGREAITHVKNNAKHVNDFL